MPARAQRQIDGAFVPGRASWKLHWGATVCLALQSRAYVSSLPLSQSESPNILVSTNYTRAACGIHEESKASLTPALAGSLGMLALIMTGLRMAQRTMMKRSFGWDDGLIVMAMVWTGLQRSRE